MCASRGREAAAGLDPTEPAEGTARALCPGRLCVSVCVHLTPTWICVQQYKRYDMLYITQNCHDMTVIFDQSENETEVEELSEAFFPAVQNC